MATLTVQDSPEAGGVTFAAATSGGDVAPNDGKTVLLVLNIHASLARTVTVTAQDTTANAPGFGACQYVTHGQPPNSRSLWSRRACPGRRP